VIGLLLWIPLLTRTVVTFSMVTLMANVTQDGNAIRNAHANIKFATCFYVMGFENIWNWTENEGATEVPIKFGSTIHPAVTFFLEILWTTIWWGMALYTLFY